MKRKFINPFKKALIVVLATTNLIALPMTVLANPNKPTETFSEFSLPPGVTSMEDLIGAILMANGGVFNQNAAGMLLSALGIPVTPANVNGILNTVLTGTGGVNTAVAVIPFFNNFALAGPETLIQPPSNNNFSSVIRDNVSLNSRVVDIAMLGAHNSFSNGIRPSSNIDPNDPLFGSDIASLAPGFVSRLGRTQYGNAMNLLNRGVRYLDVRVTNVHGHWHTENTMLSNGLRYYVLDVIRFLQQNPGELVIFDLQHITLGNASIQQFWNYLATLTVGGQNLFDFVNINPNTTPLGTVTLGHATNNGASGGVIIVAEQPTSATSSHYHRSTNMRSRWLQQDTIPGLIMEIEREQALIGDGRYANRLRVNQASISLATSGDGLLNSINSWSYMLMAEMNNAALLNQDINRWLSVTPIFMVGYAESSHSNFNARAINIINTFNRGL